jgi:abnormal spindle-like microcephaly-associated protein
MNASQLRAAPIRPHRPKQDATTTLKLPRNPYADSMSNATQDLTHQLYQPSISQGPRRMSTMRPVPEFGSNALPPRNFELDNTTTHLDLHNTTRAPTVSRRPVAAILAERLAAQAAREREEATARGIVGHRESRRRTIYVPDDTSVLTIHPSSSINSDRATGEKDGSIVQHRPVRRGTMRAQRPVRRRSSVMPLVEEALDLTGVIPMGPSKDMKVLVEEVEEDQLSQLSQLPAKLSKPPRRKSMAFMMQEKKAASQAPALQTLQEDDSYSNPKKADTRKVTSNTGRPALHSVNSNNRVMKSKPTPTLKDSIAEQKRLFMQRKPVRKSIAPGLNRTLSDENVIFVVGKPKQVSVSDGSMLSSIHDKRPHFSLSTLNTSTSRAVSDPAEFSILKDDLAHPELYEENWLEHHEIALTQLLNAFFDSTDAKHSQDQPFHVLRSKLLTLHNDPDMPHLHKRMQASLMYGSLAVPKDLLARSLRLKEDVGQRRKFLNIFLDVYDLVTLQAAAEVIAGREFSPRSRASTESTSESQGIEHGDRRSIEQYLDHFFIQHCDVSVTKTNNAMISALARDKVDQVGSPMWAWRRTVTRSLMLVLLLDKAKHQKIAPGCLFQKTSPFKSSEAVVKALGAILLPSHGDLMRPLKHLKFDVFVEQHPIEEFSYHVDNIATDLRDGIRLTRIVEILLGDSHAASALSTSTRETWTLSQHLKYPCPGRTHKLQNAMAALSAMVRLPSMPEKLLKDVSAYDIVDGHREKTLSLLWAMLGQYAMDSLVDWKLVKRETVAAQESLARAGKCTDSMEDISDVKPTSTSKCWGMLFQWAKSIAALQDISITNLTTSFAGSAAFKAILQTYLPYLPGSTGSDLEKASLEASLRAAGCSSAFTNLLSAPQSIIPTRDFTLTSLTFLAARLLPATRAHRGACTIQRAYRHLQQRRELKRRVALMRLASHCAAVVSARDHVIGAAVVLQRAWRCVLDNRIRRLEMETCVFQSVARGWLVRTRHTRKGKEIRERRAGW